MRSKNGRFAKKEAEEDAEIESIERFEYTDLWVYKVIDAFTRALVGLIIRLSIQIFFIMIFAMVLKKIGLLDIIREIFGMFMESLNFGYSVMKKEDSQDKSNGNGT